MFSRHQLDAIKIACTQVDFHAVVRAMKLLTYPLVLNGLAYCYEVQSMRDSKVKRVLLEESRCDSGRAVKQDH